jgi:D-glycero-D-manno-heptose 1,7-bisphosphate phosphatase
MNRAVLLDRDGTLIVERNYLCDPAGVELESGVGPALRRLQDAGFLLIVITNQSGIGRGLYTEAQFRSVQDELGRQLAEHGVRLAGDYHCPHHPKEARGEYLRACECRKPAPGMLRAALADFDVDPATSFMVGDTWNDVAAGRAAGVRGILVRTGYGANLEREAGAVVPDHVADDLGHAVDDYILASRAPETSASAAA